jgi:hypothetical protein
VVVLIDVLLLLLLLLLALHGYSPPKHSQPARLQTHVTYVPVIPPQAY